MTLATRAKLGVLAVLAAGVVVWLLLHDFVGHAGTKAVKWRDLTARVGPLELPFEVSHVFTTRAQLASYLHWRRYRDEPRVPNVDFGRHRVLIVSSGVRTSSATSLQVVQVVEQHGRIVVSLRLRTASLGGPGSPRLVFPYVLVTVPPGGKHVQLKWLRS